VVKFASRDELCHDARALFKGNTMDDTCRLEQVEFLCPTKLGEDEIDFSFNRCFSVILGVHLQTCGGEREEQRTDLHTD
jgi:hypothetical protein